MKTFKLYSYFFFHFAITLTICYPFLQITANNFSSPVHIESKILKGKLKNGMTFSLFPAFYLKDGLWIELNCNIPPHESESAIPLLTQHALFYGTKNYQRQDFTNFLNDLALDIETNAYIQNDKSKHCLHLCLSSPRNEQVRKLLEMMYEMAFFPTLKDEDIELARNHLLSNLEQKAEKDSLQNITASAVRNFHNCWYCPDKMHLTLIGVTNFQEILAILSESFQSPIDFKEEIFFEEVVSTKTKESDEIFRSSFIDHIEWIRDNQTFVIDGKIWMKKPNWINKSFNGKTLGILLTILGIGGMIVAFPLIVPAAFIVGGLGSFLTTATGVYFLTSDYLKDPYYLEKLRQVDLKKGCIYAYQNHHAGITLTPYERRALLLQEIVEHSQTLSNQPILILADLYELNDPIIAEIFTNDEFNMLKRIKGDFIRQRNQYTLLKEELEKELAALIAPYTLARDAALLHAQNIYQQNDYVILKNKLIITKDTSIANIEKAYQDNSISLEEKEAMIDQIENNYKTCLSDPTLQLGLDLAKSTLTQMELEIQSTYDYQKELCKQSIQYYPRMERIKFGKQSLIHFFDQELVALIRSFPIYLSTLPDYLDLRSL